MSDNQGEFSKSCHFQMMVYILCGDGDFQEGRGLLVGGREEWGSCTVKERHLLVAGGTAGVGALADMLFFCA